MSHLDLAFKSKLGARKQTHCHVWFLRSRKATGVGSRKSRRNEPVTDLGGARRDDMKAIIAHFRVLPLLDGRRRSRCLVAMFPRPALTHGPCARSYSVTTPTRRSLRPRIAGPRARACRVWCRLNHTANRGRASRRVQPCHGLH